MRLPAALLFAATCTFAAAPQPANWVVIFQEDFEKGLTDDWRFSGSDVSSGSAWKAAREGANGFVSGSGHIHLYLTRGPWTDYRVKARLRLSSQGALSLNFRQSGCARYGIGIYPGSVDISKSSAGCGPGPSAGPAPANYASSGWRTLEVVGVGGNIRVYIDSVLKIDWTDPSPALSGSTDFEVQAGAVDLDDVEISGPPIFDTSRFTWVRTGGPIGGTGYDIKVRPDNPDVMFATDITTGLNVSRDGGRTWAPSNSGITSLAGSSGNAVPIFCVGIDPNAPDTMWAGTQNTRGIFKSIDGGKTWVEKTNGIVERSGITFRGLTVDPHTSSIVYAAAEISSFAWAGESRSGREFDLTKGVVYRTTNGGESWSAIWRGDNLARYVIVDPRNSNVIYVSTGIFDREAANSVGTSGNSGGVGVLKTTDGGRTWRELNASNGLLNLYVGSLFMNPRNPDILLAGTGAIGNGMNPGVYITTDGGEHWQRGWDADARRWVPYFIYSVEISTTDPSIAYAAGPTAFYRSSDGGINWHAIADSGYGPRGIRLGAPIDLQADPRDPNRVFLNNYGGGNFLTEDGGRTWQNSSRGYTGATVNSVSVAAGDWQTVYSVGNSGMFRTDSAGDGWVGVDTSPDQISAGQSVAADPSDPNRVLIAGTSIGRSNNRGASWQPVFTLLYDGSPENRHGFKSLVFAPSDPRIVYAGAFSTATLIRPGFTPFSFGVYKSRDRGETWQEANDSTSATQIVASIAVDPRDPAVVYAGTTQHGVLRSRDGGRSWSQASQGLQLIDVRALAVSPADSKVVFAGLFGGGIFVSTDAGDRWQRSGIGMDPQAQAIQIVFDPLDPQTIYAADSFTGVYRSLDGGKIWVRIGSGLTSGVNGFSIAPDGSALYAATTGQGVFRLDLKPHDGSAVAALSAASFLAGAPVAPNSIVSLYGTGLAAALQQAGAGALPSALGETQVSLTDSDGYDFWTPLYFVSPGQINFLVPSTAKTGAAQVRVFRQNKVVARGTVQVEVVAPGLFTANASGQGVPAAQAARYGAGGEQTAVPVFQCGATAGSCAPAAMDLGAESDQLILMLYGTGLRAARSVTATIGGVDATVLGFAAQSQYAGLDQVNVRVPRELKGRGEVDVQIKADGKAANTVKVRIQ